MPKVNDIDIVIMINISGYLNSGQGICICIVDPFSMDYGILIILQQYCPTSHSASQFWVALTYLVSLDIFAVNYNSIHIADSTCLALLGCMIWHCRG